VIGRFFATFGLIGLLKMCGYERNDPKRLTCKELLFIWYAGLIRGAIAFGLVLRVDADVPNRSVIVTTCLSLVVFTTIVFGSSVGLLSTCLLKDSKSPVLTVHQEAVDERSVAADTSKSQVYLPLLHYNEREESNSDSHQASSSHKESKRKKKLRCADYLMRLDRMILRPILIHKYEKDKEARA